MSQLAKRYDVFLSPLAPNDLVGWFLACCNVRTVWSPKKSRGRVHVKIETVHGDRIVISRKAP